MPKVNLTAGRIEALTCPAGRAQAFIWDAGAPGLGVRATPSAYRSFIFQSEFKGTTVRLTIGDVKVWSIPAARERARELQRQIDQGRDPRAVKAESEAADREAREALKRRATTFGEAWQVYLADRKPLWSARHYEDHVKLAQTGGIARRRARDRKTIAGPLAPFLSMRLIDVDAVTVHAWAARECATRPARARLALRLLKAFLRWCAAEPAYADAAHADAASSKRTREATGTAKRRNDALQREQLPAWFSAVSELDNAVIAAYLQCLLLTGARREELATLKWSDVNFRWRGIVMRDKIEGERVIPLTPYVAHLLSQLPRRNAWVFSSPTSASGRLTEPSIAHRRACAAAGVPGLTLHGLRRSFASLCEWIEVPGGISAQIQGHAPQGVREQNYIRRPLDLLRVWHDRIEAWILENAKVRFDPAAPAKLTFTLVA